MPRSPVVLRFEHTRAGQDEMLPGHLLEVARRCNDALFQRSQPARRVAVCAGLTHDVGKATVDFQRALRRGQPGDLAAAAACSAAWSWWLSRRLVPWERVASAAAVLAHHGQLSATPVKAIQRLASQGRNSKLLSGQLGAMDMDGVGQFLVNTGSRFMMPVPAAGPKQRQQLLDELPEGGQLAGVGMVGLERVEEFLEEHPT